MAVGVSNRWSRAACEWLVRTLALPLSGAALLVAGPVHAQSPATPQQLEFFEKTIRPILSQRCYECHSDKEQKSKLRLDHITTVLKGGERGPAIVPGDPAKSNLVRAIE